MSELRHYRHIDGLRAVAVTSVVVYHAGSSILSGGFVGVDIFFVISGFLIINQIVSGLDAGTFSFSDFWSKRALRILPPYLLVVATSAILASYVLVLPAEIEQFGMEALASAGMVVNHLFLAQQGYFDGESEAKILLHLWSLAVEEQFYLLAPLMLGTLWWLQFSKRISVIICAVLTALSFAACIYWTGTGLDKNYSFYLMPLRAWEFAIGGALVLIMPRLKRLPVIYAELISIAGLALIAFALLSFSKATPFPSYNAAVPVLGTALVIAAGLSAPRNLVSRILGQTPFVWIGLVSYAWYLWHWPLMATARIYNFGALSWTWGLAAAIISLLLAIATHLWIERPVLRWRRARGRKPLGWRPSVVGVFACILAAAIGWRFAFWLPVEMQDASPRLASASNIGDAAISCHLWMVEDDDQSCLEAIGGRNFLVVFGDSHAGRIDDVLGDILPDSAIGSIAIANCPSLFDTRVIGFSPVDEEQCVASKALALERMGKALKPDSALLVSHWTIYGKWFGEPQPGEVGRFLGEVGADVPASGQSEFYKQKLIATIGRLYDLGIERIAIVAPVPEMPRRSPECVARAEKYKTNIDEKCSIEVASAKERRAGVSAILEDVLHEFPNLKIVDPFPTLCDENWCRSYTAEVMLYSDQNHILPPAVRRIAAQNSATLDWLDGK